MEGEPDLSYLPRILWEHDIDLLELRYTGGPPPYGDFLNIGDYSIDGHAFVSPEFPMERFRRPIGPIHDELRRIMPKPGVLCAKFVCGALVGSFFTPETRGVAWRRFL